MVLDVIIPIYNPLSDWAEEVVRQYDILIKRLPSHYVTQLIMVNDGSERDLSKGAEFIQSHHNTAKWISYSENHGKGYALRQAVKESSGDYIMYTDYDFPYTFGSMVNMLDKLINEDYDAVVGNRDESYYNHISKRRSRISKYLRQFNSLLFNLPTDDTQCGLKAFKGSIKPIFLSTQTDRYLIDVEFLKLLVKSKAKVGIQLVKLRENIVLSKISNVRLAKELYSYLKIMLS